MNAHPGGPPPGPYRPAPLVITVLTRGHKDPGRFVFLGATASDDRRIAGDLRDHSASHNADDIFHTEGGFTGIRDFEPGPFGGVLRCGSGSGDTAAMCVWVDGSTVGMFASPNPDVAALARVALDFRNAAER